MGGDKIGVQLLEERRRHESRSRNDDPVRANRLAVRQLDVVATCAREDAPSRLTEKQPRSPKARDERRHERVHPAAERDERRAFSRHRLRRERT